MIGIIAAVSINSVIGVNGKLPFSYPEDMAHFKNMTKESVVIMGRKTFESIGRPLPKRDNIIISSSSLEIPGAKCHASIPAALQQQSVKLREGSPNIWFIGGASIYQEAMLYADEIHLTLCPDYISEINNVVKFPFINPLIFSRQGLRRFGENNRLVHCTYTRLVQGPNYNEIIERVKSS
jgi:dihydrofolate reductase